MAKRYVRFEDLYSAYNGKEVNFLVPVNTIRTYNAEQAFRFQRTLGQHGLVVKPISSTTIEVIGVSSNMKETGSVLIHVGETLGYNCGEVWKIPNLSSIKDPLRKARLTYKLAKDRIVWVDKNYVHKFDMDILSAGEQYVSFRNGETRLAVAPFGFVTEIHRKVGPIDQRSHIGDFYVLKGTPRKEVASFIEGVFKGTWKYDGECSIHCENGEVRDIKL